MVKGQRISWLGHLERMEEDRMPKKIFTQELEGSRRRGRPMKRWREEIERDLEVLSLSCASPNQSIYPHPTTWRSILILSTHLRLGLPSGLYPSGFLTKTLSPPPLPYAPHAQSISLHIHTYIYICVYKVKVIPLQARCGPEGGLRYSSTLP